MEAEKYVGEIVKKVKCTKAKKQEIKKQLLSDISMRIEAGELPEEIMESMGTPAEIAEDFSQNLSEADKKAYTKKKVVTIAMVIVLALLCLGLYVWWIIPKAVDIGGDVPFSQEEIAAEAEAVIEILNQDDYDSLQAMAIDEIKAMLNQEVIGGVKNTINEDWGEMQSIGHVYISGVSQKGKLLIVTQVDVIYENVSVVYTISFDEDMKLAGLYMR